MGFQTNRLRRGYPIADADGALNTVGLNLRLQQDDQDFHIDFLRQNSNKSMQAPSQL